MQQVLPQGFPQTMLLGSGGMVDPSQVPIFPPGLNETQKPIPITTHLHDGENSSIFHGQPSTNLWYQDHVLGITIMVNDKV